MSAFLASSPEEVSRRTGGLLRAPFIETLQHRARELGLATHYVPLESVVVAESIAPPARGSRLVRDLALRLWRWFSGATSGPDEGDPEDADAFEEFDGGAVPWRLRSPEASSGPDPEPEPQPDPLDRWLRPFLALLRHKSQRRWAPVYVRGLLEAGARKCVTAMAGRLAPRDVQQLHHFVATSRWDPAPLWSVLAREAGRLTGGPGCRLVLSAIGLKKKGRHSAGVARQFCPDLGRRENCQLLISLTLVRGERAVVAALAPYLPEEWAYDATRRRRVGIPEGIVYRPPWAIALDAVDFLIALGVSFGGVVIDRAAFGAARELVAGLDGRGVRWSLEGTAGRGRRKGGAESTLAASDALERARAEHARLKREFGLEAFEGRSWIGLQHHVLLSCMAACYRHVEKREGGGDR
ncbi:MAG TPA: transposase [Nannocystis sp.]